MTDSTVTLVKGSDTPIEVTLTEDGDPIAVTWTEIEIYIGNPALVTINRTDDEDGVVFAAGVLTINPADLTAPEIAEIAALADGALLPMWVKVTDATNDDGVDFGAAGSDGVVSVLVQSRP
jgi:hypothetical protein